jgi:hypothetical protein
MFRPIRSFAALAAFSLLASSALAWWPNRNDWGAAAGNGGYSSFSVSKVNSDFKSSYSGVWHKPNGYVILFPCAVEGWAFNSDWYLWVTLNNSNSYVGCYFNPQTSGFQDSDDAWDVSIDIWCHNSKSGNPADEVMMWNSWKVLQPIGSQQGSKAGYEYWQGWNGWNVRTMRSWGKSGSIDVKQLCINAGVGWGESVSGVHSGVEVMQGSANFTLAGYSTWWRSN